MSETEIVTTPTVGERVRKSLSRAKASVSDVLRATRPEASKVTLAETPIPQDPSLNEEAWDAIEKVAGLLGALELPKHRRMLSAPELEDVTRTYEALQTAQKGLDRARNQIKAAAFNHFDAVAVQEGKITEETQFTKEGWAVVEDKESATVEGLRKVLTREVSGGKIQLPLDSLRDLVEDEKLDQADFLALTKQIRVVDEDRVMAWLRKNADRADVLAEATEVGKSSASFWLRDR
jgi:hypothetical protein